jgi:putative ABC transport system permease protein
MSKRKVNPLKQLWVLLPITLGNIQRAKWPSITLVACISLVVVMLMIFLGMAQGFNATAASAGSDEVVVFLGQKSSAESNSRVDREVAELLQSAPGIVRESGKPLTSWELTMTVSARRKTDQIRMHMTMRGLEEVGVALRDGFHLAKGRMFAPGRREVIIGRKLAGDMEGAEVGSTISLAGRQWTIVGIYALASPVFESELWTDLGTIQSAYGRENQIQSVRARLIQAAAMGQIADFIQADPRLVVDALTERELYQEQVRNTSDMILYLGWPLAGVMAVGALAGVLNSLLITIEARRHALHILRLLGFSRSAITLSMVMEATILALAGAALGILVAYWAVDGTENSLVGTGFTTVTYYMQIDAMTIAQGIALALSIGILGGVTLVMASMSTRRI